MSSIGYRNDSRPLPAGFIALKEQLPNLPWKVHFSVPSRIWHREQLSPSHSDILPQQQVKSITTTKGYFLFMQHLALG